MTAQERASKKDNKREYKRKSANEKVMLKRVGNCEKKLELEPGAHRAREVQAHTHMSFHSIPFSVIQLHCASLHKATDT